MNNSCNSSIFSDKSIVDAVHKIIKRNEQMIDEKSMLLSFYDDNMVGKLDNINNQIIQGRRGTGKTHLLRVLSCNLSRSQEHAIYIDCKKFWNSGSMHVSKDNLEEKSTELFKYFINEFLANLVTYYNPRNYEYEHETICRKVCKHLNSIADACHDHKYTDLEVEQEIENTKIKSNEHEGSVGIEPNIFSSLLRHKTSSEKGSKIRQAAKFRRESTIIFPNISQSIEAITELTGTRLYLLIDEWSSLPLIMQPVFAEFLKRCFLCCKYITVKIAITYETNFLDKYGDMTIGLERSTEVPLAIDLDQQLLFDKKPRRVMRFMSELLVKHIKVITGNENIKVKDLDSGFKTPEVYAQLVRAAEGNARDFINILDRCLTSASFSSNEEMELITSDDVLDAANSWFYDDKYYDISRKQQQQFDALFAYLVLNKSTRGAFIYESQLSNPDIIKLIDKRLIHVISKGHLNQFLKKERLALIILDYGSYSNQLQLGMCLDLFNDDPWEKYCRLPNSIKPRQNYWPYDGRRSVVSCFVDINDKDIIGEVF